MPTDYARQALSNLHVPKALRSEAYRAVRKMQPGLLKKQAFAWVSGNTRTESDIRAFIERMNS